MSSQPDSTPSPRRRVRRVTRVIRDIDAWSVFKVALVFNVMLYLVCLTSGVLLWNVAHATGTVDNVEKFFEQLVAFTKSLNEEERRGLAENLNEEQLAVYDLLMRPAPELTDAERNQVKKVAESLLELLRREKLVLDWRKQQQARAAVRLAIEETLDHLPDKFDTGLYTEKCDLVYQHVFDSYWDDGKNIYSAA